ncbi:MAG TPA: HlyD family efflux transporter periplasmic adaptor subunit [Methylocella sp.]|nr:HlyD family efflux transporter periplasmic adaptor subunit [Methylocella sp.]
MFFRKIFLPLYELLPAGPGGKLTQLHQRGFSPRTPPHRHRTHHLIKIAIASAIFGVGLTAIFSGHGKIASSNAVISTNLISLRTPIEGTVTSLPRRAGAMAERGALIAHIENPRVNDERLVDLREQQTRLVAELQGAETNRAAWIGLAAELANRDAMHTEANSERLQDLVEEAEDVRAALVTKQAQAENDVDRRLPLEASGVVAKAEMHKLRSGVDLARQETAAQTARLAALRAEAKAAARGVLIAAGAGTDRSYSAQRADEIGIELSRLDRTIAILSASVKETRARLDAEERRVSLWRSADITAPSNGMIWKLGASDGERLGIGDMTAEIVDCAAPLLLVAIPQDRFTDVEIGGLARFRLSGERIERTGTVLSVAGHGDAARGHHFAIMPLEEPSTAIVTILLAGDEVATTAPALQQGGGPPKECFIGRSARVSLPATGGGFIDQILRHVL